MPLAFPSLFLPFTDCKYHVFIAMEKKKNLIRQAVLGEEINDTQSLPTVLSSREEHVSKVSPVQSNEMVKSHLSYDFDTNVCY